METSKLIETLRFCGDKESCCTNCPSGDRVTEYTATECLCDLMQKAANAIEELQTQLKSQKCNRDSENATIAHGVTVQEEAKLYWKPVKPGEWNLTCSACDSHLGCREGAKHCPECGAKFVYPKAVMPQPPKGE